MARETADAVIIGAGAAGLMCAIEAGKRGRRVVVLEHNPRVGRRILLSGGGRCNFTNRHATAENFVSANAHFAKSALARYTPRDFIAMVERHGIAYHEKTLGQLFCDRAASDIVEMLETECAAAGVRIETSCAVAGIGGTPGGGFGVETSRGVYQCGALVIATGGLSIPKMGATPFGYAVARQFGLHIVECHPALVPFTFGGLDGERFAGMAGVSADVTAKVTGRRFREKLVFTHRGLSGPAILQVSCYWRSGEYVEIDLLPGVDFAGALVECRAAAARSEVRTVLA
ncbi:MAG: aminoacetone oxidase family FAD-binding enzyme, partial [Candidatus Solibacter sp.]|nr:aminoacetone oxidase family FAD-binding enzyme [Candidatus Solibacter sp.]